jgi:hypothetical protein
MLVLTNRRELYAPEERYPPDAGGSRAFAVCLKYIWRWCFPESLDST